MIAILGDSHTIALKDGYDAVPEKDRTQIIGNDTELAIGQLNYATKFLESFHTKNEDGIRFSLAQTEDFFKKILKTDSPYIQRQSSTHFVISLGFHPSGSMLPKRWAKHARKPNVTKRSYVSQRAFQTYVREYNQHILEFYKDLLTCNINFSVASCCPLPIGYYVGDVADIFEKEEMAEWHLDYRNSFARELDSLNICYHTPPIDILETDGLYMRQEFASDRKIGDYHANSKYGQIMLRKILSELRLRTHNQNSTVAARAIAETNTFGHRS